MTDASGHFREVQIENGPLPGEDAGKKRGNGKDTANAKPSFLLPGQFPQPQPPRLIHGFMAHGDEACFWGAPEAGKSFFTVDMACRFAAEGESWRGRAVDHGAVVYFAGERQQSIRDRITAWAIRNGKQLTPQALPVLVLSRPLNLMKPEQGELQRLADEIQAVIEGHKLPPVIAMFADTVHSLSPGSKEDAQSFGWMIGNARELRELVQQPRQHLPALAYVHHSGKNEDQGPRGSNSLSAGMNLSAGITVVQSKWRVIEVDKNSDLQHRPKIEPFVIESVTVGHVEDEPVRIGCHVACGMDEVRYLNVADAKAKAIELSNAGWGIREIAKHIGRPKSTVHRWLQ